MTANAANCYTYVDINTCESCVPGSDFGLKKDANNITSCVTKNVSNCRESTNIHPFKCLTCNTGYYPDAEGQCVAADAITNCDIFEGQKVCKKCNSPYVLSVDKGSCISLQATVAVDGNCNDLQLLETAVCSACKMNFKFVSGVCSQCQPFDLGCFNCNYSGKNVCIACTPGYYMNSNQKCVQISQPTDSRKFEDYRGYNINQTDANSLATGAIPSRMMAYSSIIKLFGLFLTAVLMF